MKKPKAKRRPEGKAPQAGPREAQGKRRVSSRAVVGLETRSEYAATRTMPAFSCRAVPSIAVPLPSPDRARAEARGRRPVASSTTTFMTARRPLASLRADPTFTPTPISSFSSTFPDSARHVSLPPDGWRGHKA